MGTGKRRIRVGNAAGFLGDQLSAPRTLVEYAPLDYLTLEYLAELTLSILAQQRRRSPDAGYARDFVDVVGELAATLSTSSWRIVTNAGGVNPIACVREVSRVCVGAGLAEEKIAAVTGDDLLPQLRTLRAAGCDLRHLETEEPLAKSDEEIVCANAYLGARPIVDALDRQARIVVTGRVADASLTVGPCVHEFGWEWSDLKRLAGASVAGHLIECGSQVTGGYSTSWTENLLADVGYPIAEIDTDGHCTIAKPDGSGGRVDRQTVAEQLVYEIGDPAAYLTPDVSVDFTQVELQETASNRVHVRGAVGVAPPQTYKVSLAFRDGFTANAQLLVYGDDCQSKAHACAEMIAARLARAGATPEQFHVELLGAGAGVPGLDTPTDQLPEVMLRLSVREPNRATVERFTKEIAPLITSGPAGLAGYAASRSRVRPAFAFWPTSVPMSLLKPQVAVKPASEWSASCPTR